MIEKLKKLIPEFPVPEDYIIQWEDSIKSGDYNGVFKPLTGKIHLSADYKDDERIIPTIAHEMTHFNQYRRNKLLYWLFIAFPFFIKVYESEAEAWEKRFNEELNIPEQRQL